MIYSLERMLPAMTNEELHHLRKTLLIKQRQQTGLRRLVVPSDEEEDNLRETLRDEVTTIDAITNYKGDDGDDGTIDIKLSQATDKRMLPSLKVRQSEDFSAFDDDDSIKHYHDDCKNTVAE